MAKKLRKTKKKVTLAELKRQAAKTVAPKTKKTSPKSKKKKIILGKSKRKPVAIVKRKPIAKRKTVVKAKTKPKPKHKPIAKRKPVVKSKPKAKRKPIAKRKTVVKAKPKTKPIAKRKPVVKSKPKPKPKPKAKPSKRKPLTATINGTTFNVRDGLRPIVWGIDIVSLAKLNPDLAIIRHNGTRVTTHSKIKIRRGDQFTVREFKKRKHRRPKPIVKSDTRAIERELSFQKAFPEEWTRWDGSLALQMSFVRSDPRAETWYAQLRHLQRMWGTEGRPFKDRVREIAEEAERPIGEVYTLLWSH